MFKRIELAWPYHFWSLNVVSCSEALMDLLEGISYDTFLCIAEWSPYFLNFL